MTTLYVCYFGLREPLVQTQVLPYLRELVGGGITVHLLTFEPGAWIQDERTLAHSKLQAEGISWHALRYHKRPSWLATTWDIAVGVSITAALVAKHNIEIVHARSHVPLVMALGARVITGCRVIFDLRGLMAEEYADAGIWRDGSVPFLAVKAAEKLGLRSADEVVVLTERFRAWLVSAGLARSDRITVIPCCTPMPLTDGHPPAPARERLEVVYAGSVGGLYLLEQMGRFVLALQTLRPGVFFRVLTQAASADVSERLIRSGLAPGDFWVGAAKPEDVRARLRGVCGGLSFRKGTFSQIAASPTKVAEYLAAGLPVVTNAGIGDLDALLANERVGVSIPDFRWETLLAGARQFDDLLRAPDLANRCRETARRQYDLSSIGGARYRAVYARLAARSRSKTENATWAGIQHSTMNTSKAHGVSGEASPRPGHAMRWRWNYDIRVRYAPVVREVRLKNPAKDWTVLDVGCGEMGIAPLLAGWSVTGLDQSASVRLSPAARLLRGSAVRLPFRDGSWDVVICVDVLEHLSPGDRELALWELMRVARRLLIVAHPAGDSARLADERFRDAFGSPPNMAPQWLQEHLAHKYPDGDLVPCWLREHDQEAAGAVHAFGNESLLLQRSHRFLARHSRTLYLAWSAACSLVAPILGRPLPRGKAYRVVNVLRLGTHLRREAASVTSRQAP